MTYIFKFFHFLLRFHNGLGELIRAGGSSAAAVVARKAGNDFVCVPAFKNFRDCRKVSGTAAGKNDVVNGVVIIQIKRDFA